ncbi:hypothetical protein [Picosynechococcus sp. PCC 7117]|uniref:hypothetical protein n=1 Tax=Picosynechococcus sp. PCC 7117 TaxID=195498 RepID=UPI000810903D|nr:hypothetical protein [Picosynechococcus sp. PCC 7117]ANV88502.1 hypothetical protein AWQ22_14100 [Picosynechococcus sp. PCC 7117]
MEINTIKFPLTVANGSLQVVSGADRIRSHILHYLQVFKDERVMRPEYGIDDYLFDNVSNVTAITSDLLAGLNRYIPEAQFSVNGTVNDLGEVLINIYWLYEDVESSFEITL